MNKNGGKNGFEHELIKFKLKSMKLYWIRSGSSTDCCFALIPHVTTRFNLPRTQSHMADCMCFRVCDSVCVERELCVFGIKCVKLWRLYVLGYDF